MKNKLFTLLFALLASVGFAKAELVQIADTYNMAQDSVFTLGAFDVVYVNGAYCYIKDATGYGMIYQNNYGLQAGDHVAAGMEGKINIYYGCYEITPLTTVADLTVTAGEIPTPMEATEVPSANNVNQYVVYKNVSFATDTAFTEVRRNTIYGSWNGQQIRFYNQFRIGATLQANKLYNITAFNGISNTNIRVYPVAVEEVTGEGPCTTLYGVCGDNLTWELTCDSVLTISGSGAMWGALPTWAPYKEQIKIAILPDGIDSIAPKAFYNCTNLTSVNMPNSVRALGTKTFVGCDRLTEPVYNEHIFGFMPRNYSGAYSVPEGIVSIAAYAFAECVDLTEITLPSSVLRLGINALGATFLTKITCYAAVPPTCNTNAFKYYDEETGVTVSVNTSIPVYVPAESLTAYQSADQWQDFTNILPIGDEPETPCTTLSGTCGENLTWELTCDSVLTISGTGAMTDYEYSEDDHAPWYEYRNVIKSAIISDGVTSIGWWAFYDCRYMTSVEISNSVTSIGGAAFGDCNSLTSVTIPNSVTSIGEDAFAFITSLVSITVAEDNQYYCSSEGVLFNKDKTTLVQYPAGNTATSYVIPNSVTYIRVNAFCHGRHLISVDIPNSVTRIGVQAFYCCRGLTSIEIPNSVTSIEGDAFRDCPGLASIVVASGNQIYDSRDNCNAIIKTATNTLIVGCKNTIIPNSVIAIYTQAFIYCSDLKSIEIPNSVTSIGYGAFFGCSSLTSVINNATTPQSIDASVFDGVNKSSCILYVPEESVAAYQAADVWKDFGTIIAIGEEVEPQYVTIADTYNMAQDSAFTLGAFDVVYVASFQNGANIYIKDESGYGVIYKPGYGLQAGDHVEAGLQGKANIYHGLYEVIPVSAKENLTITSGEAPAPMEATEAPTLNNVNQYVVYKNVTFDVDTAFVEGLRHLVIGLWNNQEIYFYNQYYIGATLQANKAYNIIAVNTVYGTVPQAYPVAVEEVSGEEPCTTLYGTCGENLTWELSCDSVLTISGTGAMTDFANRAAPWYENRLAIRTLQIGNEVTTIGTYAFTGCSELTSITIGDNITSVGQRAFRDCSNIRTVTIGKNVVALGNGVFNNCNRIEAVQWNAINFRQQKPNQDENSFPFYASRNTITSFTFGEEVEYIPAYLMKDYAAIQQITIPASVTEIGDYAFANDSFVTYMHSPIQAIMCYAVTPPTVYAATFMGIDKSTCTLYVPYASIGLYRNAYQWSEFFNILPIEEEPVEPDPTYINVNYLDQAGNLFAAEYVALHLPEAPIIEGFSFLKWQVVAGDLEDGIVIQAVYSANEPSSAPEVYTNPANHAQKLIRNGHVYILKDDKVYTIHGQKVK